MSDNRDEKGRFLVGHSEPGPGRDSLYDVSMNDQVRKLALLGLNDEEMAKFFGVTPQTFYNWQEENPAFFEAVHEGKIVADANVADSFYKRATGEHVEIEKAYRNKTTGEVEIVKVKTYIPGDASAALNWLKNRKADKWRDKQLIEHSGDENQPIRHRVEFAIIDPKG
jgi:hypothetical protein